jgi:hypothetical protein
MQRSPEGCVGSVGMFGVSVFMKIYVVLWYLSLVGRNLHPSILQVDYLYAATVRHVAMPSPEALQGINFSMSHLA